MRRAAVVAATVGALFVTAPGGTAVGADRPVYPVNPRTGVALSSCLASDDHGSPQLLDLALSRSTVDTRGGAQGVTVTVRAADIGGPGAATGISSVTVEAFRPSGAPVPPDAPSYRTLRLRPATDEMFSGAIRFGRWSPSGSWTLWVFLTDRAGNTTQLHIDDLAHAGFAATIRVRAARDLHGPTLAAARLGRRSVAAASGRHSVRVSILATDVQSGVASVTASFMPIGEYAAVGGEAPGALHLVSGSHRRGLWAGRVEFPVWNGTGSYVPHVVATDRRGRTTYAPRTPLGRDPLVLHVRTPVDHDVPSAASIVAGPALADMASGPAEVVIDVHASDAGAGVEQVMLAVDRARQAGDVDAVVHGDLVTGSRQDGIWRFVMRGDPCTGWESDTYRFRVLLLGDRAGNLTPVAGPSAADSVVVRAADHEPPDVTYDNDTGLTALFSEDTVGVSPTSAPVFRQIFRPDETAGPQIPGTWSCVDVTGAAVDCLRGPVRAASFHPDIPIDLRGYRPRLNPDGVLDVTDLQGNPVGLHYQS